METSSIECGTVSLQRIMDAGEADKATSAGQMPPQKPETDDVLLSMKSRLMNRMSPLSDEENAEMRAFHEEMREAVEEGSFNAAEMAQKAPESLKAFAEEKGIDLEEMLTEDADRISRLGGRPLPTYNSTGAVDFDGFLTGQELSRIDTLSGKTGEDAE